MRARKHILIVHHDSVRRWLLELQFSKLGFDATTADDGAEAIEKMYSGLPDVVLSDIVMPRLDGLRLAQFIRREPAFANIPVVLMTSGTPIRPCDEAMARNMGANGIVEDTNTHDQVVSAVRSALSSGPLTDAYDEGVAAELRTRFIEDGLRDSRELQKGLHEGFDLATARRLARQWAATGGSLGLLQVSQAAYETEKLLDQPDPDGHALEIQIGELTSLFSVLTRAADADGIPDVVAATLAGKRFAAVNFDDVEALHLMETLEQVRAFVRILDGWPDSLQKEANLYDGLILNIRDHMGENPFAGLLATSNIPLVAVGSSSASVEAVLNAHLDEHDFLLRPWSTNELLFRCYTVTSRTAQRRARNLGRSADSRPRILIGDDDQTTVALVQMTLKNYSMDCEAASDGGGVLHSALTSRPDVILLEINIPKLDGFEVLAALKNDDRTRNIPVFVLTSRQQETDILRGFSLGAEDFVTKPFSPMELVARIKRTLKRSQDGEA